MNNELTIRSSNENKILNNISINNIYRKRQSLNEQNFLFKIIAR